MITTAAAYDVSVCVLLHKREEDEEEVTPPGRRRSRKEEGANGIRKEEKMVFVNINYIIYDGVSRH